MSCVASSIMPIAAILNRPDSTITTQISRKRSSRVARRMMASLIWLMTRYRRLRFSISCCCCLRSETSRMIDNTCARPSISTGHELTSTSNVVPSLRRCTVSKSFPVELIAIAKSITVEPPTSSARKSRAERVRKASLVRPYMCSAQSLTSTIREPCSNRIIPSLACCTTSPKRRVSSRCARSAAA